MKIEVMAKKSGSYGKKVDKNIEVTAKKRTKILKLRQKSQEVMEKKSGSKT